MTARVPSFMSERSTLFCTCTLFRSEPRTRHTRQRRSECILSGKPVETQRGPDPVRADAASDFTMLPSNNRGRAIQENSGFRGRNEVEWPCRVRPRRSSVVEPAAANVELSESQYTRVRCRPLFSSQYR